VRAVVQRVSSASVSVDGETVAEIGPGVVALLGVRTDDDERAAAKMAERIANLRIFEDDDGKMNVSLMDCGGEALVVSNFTLYGDTKKGRRPSFTEAAPYEEGKRLFDICCREVETLGIPVQVGIYGAEMKVSLINEGPVTLLVDTGGTIV